MKVRVDCVLTTACLVVLASAATTAQTTRRVPQDVPTIQAALDLSAAGDRVVVGPGTWAGNVDFHGRDIALESSEGAAATRIQVNAGTAVRIGPFGSLSGFTVRGGTASFGAGIEVTGPASRITRNIIEYNQQPAGGYGAGIGGNDASPVIDGNLFRFNSCDGQSLSGVVAFVNGSSPVITNNVFAGNSCRAVNMTLPSHAAPQIVNNTIVGNPVGIYVNAGVDSGAQIYRNNIVAGNVIGYEVVGGGTTQRPVWQHNLVAGNGTDYVNIPSQTGSHGNLGVPAAFRDAASGDFRLLATSPAIDSGAPSGAPPTDFDGTLRPLDGNRDGTATVDIGAFEAAAMPAHEVLVSPPSGTYFQNQRVDLLIGVEQVTRVVGASVRLDGLDVTGAFRACAAFGRSEGTLTTLRCPGVPVAILAPGTHIWTVRLEFDDATTVTQSVSWIVRGATEP